MLTDSYRSTTKDDDEDGEKTIDQPEKRDENDKRGEALTSLETRSDTTGPLTNDTFEGAIGNWIMQGTKDGTLNVSAAQFGEVNAQGLPNWSIIPKIEELRSKTN